MDTGQSDGHSCTAVVREHTCTYVTMSTPYKMMCEAQGDDIDCTMLADGEAPEKLKHLQWPPLQRTLSDDIPSMPARIPMQYRAQPLNFTHRHPQPACTTPLLPGVTRNAHVMEGSTYQRLHATLPAHCAVIAHEL